MENKSAMGSDDKQIIEHQGRVLASYSDALAG